MQVRVVGMKSLWNNPGDFISSSTKHTWMAAEINWKSLLFQLFPLILNIFTHFSINTSAPGAWKREEEGGHKQVHGSNHKSHFFPLHTPAIWPNLTENKDYILLLLLSCLSLIIVASTHNLNHFFFYSAAFFFKKETEKQVLGKQVLENNHTAMSLCSCSLKNPQKHCGQGKEISVPQAMGAGCRVSLEC